MLYWPTTSFDNTSLARDATRSLLRPSPPAFVTTPLFVIFRSTIVPQTRSTCVLFGRHAPHGPLVRVSIRAGSFTIVFNSSCFNLSLSLSFTPLCHPHFFTFIQELVSPFLLERPQQYRSLLHSLPLFSKNVAHFPSFFFSAAGSALHPLLHLPRLYPSRACSHRDAIPSRYVLQQLPSRARAKTRGARKQIATTQNRSLTLHLHKQVSTASSILKPPKRVKTTVVRTLFIFVHPPSSVARGPLPPDARVS